MADVKTIMVGERRYKLPFADLIPFEEEQDASLGKAIEEAGRILVPVLCWKERKTASEDTIVDGAHRAKHAARLGLASLPKIYESFDSEDDAKARCEELNLERRHLTTAQQKELRAKRIERVAEMRRKGESTRAIAAAENISHTQVQRDIKEATGTGVPVEPETGKITGLDDKQKPAHAILCKRCKRIGSPVKNCQMCEKERKKAKKKAVKKQKPHDPLKDHFGNEIPQKRRSVWADPWIQTTYDFLCVTSEKVRMQRIGDGMTNRAKFYPYFDAKEFNDGVGFVIQYLDDLIAHIQAHRPAAVCPKCAGMGCDRCRGAGLVSRTLYEKLK